MTTTFRFTLEELNEQMTTELWESFCKEFDWGLRDHKQEPSPLQQLTRHEMQRYGIVPQGKD